MFLVFHYLLLFSPLFYNRCCCSVAKSCLTLCITVDCSTQVSLFLTVSWSLPKCISMELVTPCYHFILCWFLPLLPSIFPSTRVFSNESVLHIRWPNYWSFSFSPSNEYSGLSSFRTDWFDLFAVLGILKSLLQLFKSINSLELSLFMVQFSHPSMTTGKTIALTRWTFVSKVMSLLFNMLSRFVIAFLPRSNRLLISWLQSHFTVILDTPVVYF